jgi:cephalosporin-C deacetylase-like acetyl esterase
MTKKRRPRSNLTLNQMRKLLLVLAAAPALLGAGESLTVRSDLAGMVDRYLTQIAERMWKERDGKLAALQDARDVHARQEYIRAAILKEIGGLPERTPLNARITGRLKRDGYSVEKLIYESQPRFYVTANVYVPALGERPLAAVLGTAGHSAEGKAFETYQRMWIALVKRGFLVLAIDPPSQGERLEYFDPALGRSRVGAGVREHDMYGAQCFLTGANVARWEIWDGIRAVDYLLTRSDVDPKRIAVIGNSGGGTQSAYLAALDSRLAAAAPSCYITSWKKLWFTPGPQDAEQVFSGFIRDGLDFSDFLVSFAPRPIKMMTAIRDFFPIEGARAAFAEAAREFKLIGAEDRIGWFEYDDAHGWSKPRREATAAWLELWLHDRRVDGAEPDLQTIPPAELNCTETGQISTSLGGETIRSMNRAIAERMFAHRKALNASPAELRRIVASRLDLPETRGTPVAQPFGSIARRGCRIHKLALATEPGITVPALLFAPEKHQGRMPAVLLLEPRGKRVAAGEGGPAETLALGGRIVMVPDLRGWGESAAPKGKEGYAGDWQMAMRALLVGKNLPGMQTYDALRAFDYLASRPDVDASRISVSGEGDGALIAVFAAAVEPRLHASVEAAQVPSYIEHIRAETPMDLAARIIPGVLADFDAPDLIRLVGGAK